MGIVYLFGGRLYDFLDEHFEKTRYKKIREKILPKLKGRILDAGCGTGNNLGYYPRSASVLGVDNSEPMLKTARKKVGDLKNIEIKEMDVIKIELPNNHFDVVVASFLLCTMPMKYEKLALKELIRVAKPGAKLYFLEYIYSKNKTRKFFMKITSPIARLLYSLRFDTTLPLIKKEKNLKIERLELVHDDVVRLIVVKKAKHKKAS